MRLIQSRIAELKRQNSAEFSLPKGERNYHLIALNQGVIKRLKTWLK